MECPVMTSLGVNAFFLHLFFMMTVNVCGEAGPVTVTTLEPLYRTGVLPVRSSLCKPMAQT